MHAKEKLTNERLAIIKLEEHKRLATVESLRQEVIRELDQGRSRLELEGTEMRNSLQRRSESLDKERVDLASHIKNEQKSLEILKTSLVNKENELLARENTLRKNEMELEMHLHTLEPSLRSAERERQIAITTIEDSERKFHQLVERENRVLEAERGLRAREIAAEDAMHQARELKMSLTQSSIRNRREGEKIESAKAGLNAERFRLHTCAMEMSKQMLVIKQSLAHLLRQQRALSIVTANAPLSSSSAAESTSGLIDPAYANIIYSLEAVSGSLLALGQNLLDPKELHAHHPVFASKETEPLVVDESSSTVPLQAHENSRPNNTSRRESGLNEIRLYSAKSSEVENVQVDNVMLNAAESAKAVKSMAMKFGILST